MNVRNTTGLKIRNLLVALAAAMFISGCCCMPTQCAEGTKIDPDGGGEPVERDGIVIPGLVTGGACVIDDGT